MHAVENNFLHHVPKQKLIQIITILLWLILSLTDQMLVLPFYRNQSIDLHSKSIDWFLYGNNTGI